MATDAIREAMATVERLKAFTLPPSRECERAAWMLARWLVANAGRLRVVRPLEWENFFDDADAQYFAKTIFGMYRACRYEWSFQGKATRVNNLEEGKSACQADYDDRLAAALAPAFPTKGEQS